MLANVSSEVKQVGKNRDEDLTQLGLEQKGDRRETRKVQITGKSTYIISLPKTWVTKVKIKNGDSVVMIPRSDGTLLINPQLSDAQEIFTHTIEVDSQDYETLFRKFIGAYLAGFDVIEITSKEKLTPAMRQKIRQITHNVIGPEIIDETSTSVKVKDLLDSGDLSMIQGIKRMYMISRGMHRDAILALTNHDLELAEDVASRDSEVDKFNWMIAKQHNLVLNDVFFADAMGVKPQEVLGYLLVARSIERIADHARKLADNVRHLNKKTTILPKITEISESILKEYDEAINAFHRGQFDDANKVVNTARELGKITAQLRQEFFSLKLDTETVVALALVADSLERTRAYVIDIAETAINHQYTTMLAR
ncbi:MAG TPA: PhoU domain-containing protein [Candidatus Thermoplasmatota archaeon]|nr:PhoU domain-containing protein [Candidatus Thermoplasmatota archaeon]